MSPDTGEAIDRILVNLYLGANTTEKLPNWQAQMKNPELANARTALQELIRGEVVKARLDELHNLGKDGGNNVITWAGDGKARLIVDRIKSLSSGQTDGLD